MARRIIQVYAHYMSCVGRPKSITASWQKAPVPWILKPNPLTQNTPQAVANVCHTRRTVSVTFIDLQHALKPASQNREYTHSNILYFLC